MKNDSIKSLPKRKNRYRHSEGKRWIEVRIKDIQQIFDARDPAPFRERDLDDDFVEYIVSSAKEFSLLTPLKIVIHIEAELKEITPEAIKESIREFFDYKIDIQESELKSFLKRAQMFLGIGLFALFICIGAAQNIKPPEETPSFIGILREGIVILGWVSMWKPIELILFDWYPLYEKIRLYRKLRKTDIQILLNSNKMSA